MEKPPESSLENPQEQDPFEPSREELLRFIDELPETETIPNGRVIRLWSDDDKRIIKARIDENPAIYHFVKIAYQKRLHEHHEEMLQDAGLAIEHVRELVEELRKQGEY